jgi:hypothetical protein
VYETAAKALYGREANSSLLFGVSFGEVTTKEITLTINRKM